MPFLIAHGTINIRRGGSVPSRIDGRLQKMKLLGPFSDNNQRGSRNFHWHGHSRGHRNYEIWGALVTALQGIDITHAHDIMHCVLPVSWKSHVIGQAQLAIGCYGIGQKSVLWKSLSFIIWTKTQESAFVDMAN